MLRATIGPLRELAPDPLPVGSQSRYRLGASIPSVAILRVFPGGAGEGLRPLSIPNCKRRVVSDGKWASLGPVNGPQGFSRD